MLTLGIDAGGSATRWVLLDAATDRIVGRGEAGPSAGHIFDPAVRAKSLEAFRALCGAVRPLGTPARIAGGITGLSARNVATKVHRIKKLLAARMNAGEVQP